MFRITTETLVAPPMDHDGAGGFVTFEGKVRNRNEGRLVERLEYEAHVDLAESEGRKILEEAKRAFGLLEARAVHRVGVLEIGETAVWIGVAAAHRNAAFRACSYIIDEIKIRVPIWKKEHYADGESGWIGVDGTEPANLYRRQTILPEVGEEGQAKLAAARVLVVGAGGLGCAALPYLVGAGVGRIGISEGDMVEASNLHRQVLYGFGDQGLAKGELASDAIRRQNPFVEVERHDRLTLSSAEQIVSNYDIVLDGSDNFATKFLLNDICCRLSKPLVLASLFRFEGQLLIVCPDSPGGCLRCLWPDAPYDGCVGTCAEEGILGSVAGVFGTLQATEVLKVILGLPSAAATTMVVLDLRSLELRHLKRARRAECASCGTGTATVAIDLDWIAASERGLAVVDIREPEEWDEEGGLPDSERIPMSCGDRLRERARKGPVLLVCDGGVRSSEAARSLRADGIEAYSLAGGLRGMAGIWSR